MIGLSAAGCVLFIKNLMHVCVCVCVGGVDVAWLYTTFLTRGRMCACAQSEVPLMTKDCGLSDKVVIVNC